MGLGGKAVFLSELEQAVLRSPGFPTRPARVLRRFSAVAAAASVAGVGERRGRGGPWTARPRGCVCTCAASFLRRALTAAVSRGSGTQRTCLSLPPIPSTRMLVSVFPVVRPFPARLRAHDAHPPRSSRATRQRSPRSSLRSPERVEDLAHPLGKKWDRERPYWASARRNCLRDSG